MTPAPEQSSNAVNSNQSSPTKINKKNEATNGDDANADFVEPIPPTPTNGDNLNKNTSIKIDPLVEEAKEGGNDGEKSSSKIQTPRKSLRQNKVELDVTKKVQLSNEGEGSPSKVNDDPLKNSQKSSSKARAQEKDTTIVVNASESPSQKESEHSPVDPNQS